MAFGCLVPGKEGIEVQRDAVSRSRPSHLHTHDQSSRCCDQLGRSKAMNRYACYPLRRFVGSARRVNRCCFVRPQVWEDEGNVVDDPALVVHKQQFGDGNPLVLYIPWSYRCTQKKTQLAGRRVEYVERLGLAMIKSKEVRKATTISVV